MAAGQPASEPHHAHYTPHATHQRLSAPTVHTSTHTNSMKPVIYA